MSNYDNFKKMLITYFEDKGIKISLETSLHDSSENNHDNNSKTYVYNGEKDLPVISMDSVAHDGYRNLKKVPFDLKRNVNTVDAFLIDSDNQWYFVEFKDCKISRKKDNIQKKGMANWLMLMDIFLDMGAEICSKLIDVSNLMKFAREHITYIVVCSADKDPNTYNQVKECHLMNEHYTPEPLYKFKDYFFKDAYVYTEDFFERDFVNLFKYE